MYLVKIIIGTILILLMIISNVNGQSKPKPPSIIPISPNAAEFSKYSETQLNQSTGANTLTIPLFNIEMDGLTLPINLSYTGTAIRVDQIAGTYGLGWVLNGGGMISLSKVDGVGIKALWDISKINVLENQYTNATLLPFQFNYNFNGYSGQFYKKPNGQFVNLGDPRLSISATSHGFKIITPEGITYHFGEDDNFVSQATVVPEYTNRAGENTSGRFDLDMVLSEYMDMEEDVIIPNLYYNGRDVNPTYSNDINQWLLRKITFPNSNDAIVFNYDVSKVVGPPDQYCLIDEYSYIPIDQTVNPDKLEYIHRSFTLTRSSDRPILSVIWPNGKIFFDYEGRNDVAVFQIPAVENTEGEVQYDVGSSSSVAISKMKIYDNNNNFKKGFDFRFKYSNSNSNDPLSKRLLLSSVNEYSSNTVLPPYIFEYGFDMPHLLSNAQDFFGYYNGKDLKALGPALFQHVNIMHKIPYLTYTGPGRPMVEMSSYDLNTYMLNLGVNPIDYHSPYLIYQGYSKQNETFPNLYYDRRPTEDMKVGMLESVEYPTGGKDGFAYTIDSSQYYYHGQAKLLIGGGLKLASVYRTFGLSNIPPTEKRYFYEGGKLQYLPFFAKSYFDAGDINYNIIRDAFYGKPINSPKGSAVMFSKVTESTINYGKIVSEYDIPSYYGVNSNSNFQINCNAPELSYYNISGTNYPQYHNVLDYYPYSSASNYDWANGKLIKQTIYNQSDIIVEQNENAYSEILYGNYHTFEIALLNDVVKKLGYNYTGLDLATDGVFRFSKSHLISAWRPLTKATKTTFDQNDQTKFVTEITNYTYNIKNQLVRSEMKTNSDGREFITKNKYSNDFYELGTDELSLGILGLQQKHQINTLIESSNYYCDPILDTTKFLLSSNLTLYKNFDQKTLPWKIEIVEPSLPISNFVSAHNDEFSLNFIKDNNYNTERTFTKYNLQGKLIEMLDRKSGYISYKWGYSQNLPIAKIDNARTSINNIGNESSYIGFESGQLINDNPDEDFWNFNSSKVNFVNFSFSGKYGIKVKTSSVPFMYKNFESNNEIKKIIISGWVRIYPNEASIIQAKNFTVDISDLGDNVISTASLITNNNSTDWKYFSVVLNSPNISGLSNYKVNFKNPVDNLNYDLVFDDIRIQPEQSSMVTYTYNDTFDLPTSISDLNNIPTHYSYDDLGRLISVKDYKKNILKTNVYMYTPKNYR